MGWYKPGRNPNRPGDPPPRSAPLGRRSRSMLLVTIIANVMITLMIMVTRTAGAAAGTDGVATTPDPSSLPMSGQRVEMPEAGVALTIPEDWGFQVEMQPTDWAAEAPVAATIWQVLDSWSPAGDPEAATEYCSIVLLQDSEQGVGSMVFDGVIGDPVPIADQSAPGWTHSTTEVLLPAGPATRNDEVGHEPDGVWYSTVYNLVAPDGMVWLTCSGPVRPDDHWLSIAEGIELLPVKE